MVQSATAKIKLFVSPHSTATLTKKLAFSALTFMRFSTDASLTPPSKCRIFPPEDINFSNRLSMQSNVLARSFLRSVH